MRFIDLSEANFPLSVVLTQSTFLLKYFTHASISVWVCHFRAWLASEKVPFRLSARQAHSLARSRSFRFFSSLFPLGGNRRKSPAAAAMSSLPAILKHIMSAAGRFSPQGCAHVRDASDLFSAGAATINYSAESTNSPFRLGLLIFIYIRRSILFCFTSS